MDTPTPKSSALLNALLAQPHRCDEILNCACGDELCELIRSIPYHFSPINLDVLVALTQNPNARALIQNNWVTEMIGQCILRSSALLQSDHDATHQADVLSVLIAHLKPDLSRLAHALFKSGKGEDLGDLGEMFERGLSRMLLTATHPSRRPAALHWWSSAQSPCALDHLIRIDVYFGEGDALISPLTPEIDKGCLVEEQSGIALPWEFAIHLIKDVIKHHPHTLPRAKSIQAPVFDFWFGFQMALIKRSIENDPNSSPNPSMRWKKEMSAAWPYLNVDQQELFANVLQDHQKIIPDDIRSDLSKKNLLQEIGDAPTRAARQSLSKM